MHIYVYIEISIIVSPSLNITYTNAGETVGLMALELGSALLDDRVLNSRSDHD